MVTVQSNGPDSVRVSWRGVSTVQIEAPVSGYKVTLSLAPLSACCLMLAEKMLDERRQRVDVSVHARAAHNGLPQKRLKG